jgi:hypothetical protein
MITCSLAHGQVVDGGAAAHEMWSAVALSLPSGCASVSFEKHVRLAVERRRKVHQQVLVTRAPRVPPVIAEKQGSPGARAPRQ